MILADSRPSSILLDTCAIIYVFNGEPLDPHARAVVEKATLFVSPISAWEIGLLATRRGFKFLPDPRSWFRNVADAPMVEVVALDAEVAIASSYLPELLHRDPADRLLIATARTMDVAIMTRDRLILAYAAAGHINAIAC